MEQGWGGWFWNDPHKGPATHAQVDVAMGVAINTDRGFTAAPCPLASCCTAQFLEGPRTSTGLWPMGWGSLLYTLKKPRQDPAVGMQGSSEGIRGSTLSFLCFFPAGPGDPEGQALQAGPFGSYTCFSAIWKCVQGSSAFSCLGKSLSTVILCLLDGCGGEGWRLPMKHFEKVLFYWRMRFSKHEYIN